MFELTLLHFVVCLFVCLTLPQLMAQRAAAEAEGLADHRPATTTAAPIEEEGVGGGAAHAPSQEQPPSPKEDGGGGRVGVRLVPTHTMEELRATGKVGADGTLVDDAFREDASVTRVVLPEGLVGIAGGGWTGGAFSGCSNLVGVVLPESCTSLGRGGFRGCSSLTTITLPASLTTLGEAAFYGCTSLTTITLPITLTTLGSSACTTGRA